MWQARHFSDIPCVAEDVCVCAAIVAEELLSLWWELQERVFVKMSQDVVLSFRVAGVALCDIPYVSEGMRAHLILVAPT